jgi:hypothetical protein
LQTVHSANLELWRLQVRRAVADEYELMRVLAAHDFHHFVAHQRDYVHNYYSSIARFTEPRPMSAQVFEILAAQLF